MLNIRLPDGSSEALSRTRHRRRSRRSRSARASRAPRSPARSTASSSTPRTASSATPTSRSSRQETRGVDILRHSTAHLMAQAVKELFPDAQVTIGPVIENGFYYDFSLQAALHAGRSRGDREADGRDREAATCRSSAR